MTLRLDGKLQIENLHNYPPETVERLRALLVSGAEAQPDARRKNFYDVQNCRQIFFIHVSPETRKVMLLGSWLKDATGDPAERKACAA